MLTDKTVTQTEAVARAISEASSLRVESPIPVRVFEREGRVIWSKVDNDMRDLSLENSDGMLYHIRSLFLPHGSTNAAIRAFLDAAEEVKPTRLPPPQAPDV